MIPRPLLRRDGERRLAAENLKVCPVCGTVNARLNGECFVCRWHGKFVHDPIEIDDAMSEMLQQCPELVTAIAHSQPRKPKLRDRLRFFFRRFHIGRRLDLRI